jgi:hypothetical protein
MPLPSSRAELALLFSGHGVELGVAAGAFSVEILRNKGVRRLWSIDRWGDHHDRREYKRAAERLARTGRGRCVPLRMSFAEALPLFGDGSLNFVYIDGYAHTGQQNGRTLSDWWPKLAPGGIFAGHDYDARWPKTVAAVDAFAREHGLPPVQCCGENVDAFASWWMVKPGVPEPSWRVMQGSPVGAGESVILVGNGPSALLDGNRGAVIDGFDQVVRFNAFAIRGFEAQVGTRTTLWSTFGRGTLPRDEDVRPERAVYIYDAVPKDFVYPVKEAWGIPREFFDALGGMVRSRSQWPAELAEKLRPSSGLVVALWLLEFHGVPVITLTGFDHFSKARSSGHHYYMRRHNGQVQPFIAPKEHDGAAEGMIFEELARAGRVRYLERGEGARTSEHPPMRVVGRSAASGRR